MTQKDHPNAGLIIDRQERFLSHALVEIRKYQWLPFGIHSAILLDISLQGFKIELTSEHQTSVGTFYWLNIPLAPLGIYSPGHLSCQVQCRWFDEKRYRLGGVFTDLDKTQRLIIDQIVETLKIKGYGRAGQS